MYKFTLETKSAVIIRYFAATSRKLWRFGNSRRNYNSDAVVFGHRPVKSRTEFKVSSDALENRAKNSNLYRLVTAFRECGVKHANLDPLNLVKISRAPELWPETYGLRDMKEVFPLQGILNIGVKTANLEDILGHLKKIYLGPIAFECHQLSYEEEQEWFSDEIESMHEKECLAVEMRKNLAVEMLKSQIFDNFLASKFASLKRYGGEGAECMMGFFLEVFRKSAEFKYDEVILGMPHRGRLNILTGLLQYPPVQMFRKIKGYTEFPADIKYSGDVLSHLTSSVDLEVDGHKLHVTMLPNPSHLEAVNPVTVGKARGRQMTLGVGYYSPNDFIEKVVPLQIHGDAAFEAQGINMETLQLANVPHFTVGGSIHLIVNNQVGFTTPADRGRSTDYCSDLARMIFAPVIHVNGDYPEQVIKATTLAMNYRQRFHKDVFVDLYCYRRWGHNELDDPTFTNPVMYRAVSSKGTLPDSYANALKDAGILGAEDVDKVKSDYTAHLLRNFNEIDSFSPQASHLKGYWSEMSSSQDSLTTWDTGIDLELLRYVGAKSVELPQTFNVHPHLQKTFITNRVTKLTNGDNLDWATAEAVAFGSLLHQGFSVRLCGQDVGRGTFSHRHCMFVDYSSGSLHVPLNSIDANQAYLEVSNSILSEEAVLAFEYGMSVENPKRLVIWEAQFGDFFNGAQIIIDTFISSGETKWLLQSGIVMLLPHGYDGAGPEHSSCRLERFLQMTDSKENAVDGDSVNFEVVNPTTPAQYFHVLRRQMVRNYRKPLAVVAPKVLLRLPAATSKPADFGPGTSFKRVLDDTDAVPEKVERVIFCTGKHYYPLCKERENLGNQKTAIIRLESLCPFPTSELQKQMMKYTKAKSFIWSQEEHQNMGAWTFVAPRFENLVGCKLTYVGRGPLAAPAVAIGQLHQKEAVEVVSKAFE